jgi:hypothetical protein
MPKLLCPCGYIHDLSPIPDAGWITVRDVDDEALQGAWQLLNEISGESLPPNDHPRIDEYDRAMRQTADLRGLLYECPQCGVLLWRKPGAEEFRTFKPTDSDSDEYWRNIH